MASDLPEELRRLHHAVTRLSAKVGDMSKKLEESSTSLGRTTEERDRLNQAYNEEKRKMKKTKNDNERLMRALEIQRKEIEQQAKEIEKRDAQLDFKSKQLLVLRELNKATQVSRKLNTVKVKPKGVTNESSWDKVQVQIDTNAMHKELEEKDSGLENELNRKQTLADKEHRSNHDLQEARKVSIEEAKKEDDEKLIELIDEWGKGDTEGNGGLEFNAFQDMFPPIPPPEFLVDMCKDMPNNSSGLSSELPVPDDDIAGLEWLPTFVENSLLAGGIPLDIDFPNNNKKDDSLENSSSRSGRKTIPFSPDTVVPERARSKRPRSTAAIFNQQPALNLVSPKSSITNVQNLPMPNSYISSKSEYFAESHPPQTPKSDGKEQKKKMKKRLPPCLPSYSSDHDNLLQQQQQPGVPVKTCSHCEITETTQWRAGPMGPRTLCNACGQRYRSGRLIPEYRPAASPTFVASIHSNSRRKIVEMMKVKSTPDR